MSDRCPTCGSPTTHLGPPPPEPPVGAWVRDRFGGTTLRRAEGWGQPGIMPFGRWEAMWHARGPLVECGPWGAGISAVAAVSGVAGNPDKDGDEDGDEVPKCKWCREPLPLCHCGDAVLNGGGGG